jgi:hypothetical protein
MGCSRGLFDYFDELVDGRSGALIICRSTRRELLRPFYCAASLVLGGIFGSAKNNSHFVSLRVSKWSLPNLSPPIFVVTQE